MVQSTYPCIDMSAVFPVPTIRDYRPQRMAMDGISSMTARRTAINTSLYNNFNTRILHHYIFHPKLPFLLLQYSH